MAEKLPVIIDNRGDNAVVNAPRRLLPNPRRGNMAASKLGVAMFRPLENLWPDPCRNHVPVNQLARLRSNVNAG